MTLFWLVSKTRLCRTSKTLGCPELMGPQPTGRIINDHHQPSPTMTHHLVLAVQPPVEYPTPVLIHLALAWWKSAQLPRKPMVNASHIRMMTMRMIMINIQMVIGWLINMLIMISRMIAMMRTIWAPQITNFSITSSQYDVLTSRKLPTPYKQ